MRPPPAPALILLHGFMGSGRDWRNICAQLPSNWSVNAPDLPWHGHNPTRPADWNVLIEHLVEALLPPNAPPKHIAGYSMGGRIALGIAERAPERIASLTLISSATGIASTAEREQRIKQDRNLADRITAGDLRHFLQNWYALPLFGNLQNNTRMLTDLIEDRANNEPEALADCLIKAGTGRMPDYRNFLQNVSFDAQYIFGRDDTKFADLAKELTTACPNLKPIGINNATHALLQEAPNKIAELLVQGAIRTGQQDGSTVDKTAY